MAPKEEFYRPQVTCLLTLYFVDSEKQTETDNSDRYHNETPPWSTGSDTNTNTDNKSIATFPSEHRLSQTQTQLPRHSRHRHRHRFGHRHRHGHGHRHRHCHTATSFVVGHRHKHIPLLQVATPPIYDSLCATSLSHRHRHICHVTQPTQTLFFATHYKDTVTKYHLFSSLLSSLTLTQVRHGWCHFS